MTCFLLALALAPERAEASTSKVRAKKSASGSKTSGKKGSQGLKALDVGSAVPETTAGLNASSPPPTRGPTRLDFDDRLIQGQTNKSGSVYLYDRKELKTRSMIKKRENFREEIVGYVYDR